MKRHMDHTKAEANNKAPRRRARIPISDRDWLYEDETAQCIGAGHSTLRGWRNQDKKREKVGLSRLGRAPRPFYVGSNIRYLKVEVEKWIERNSGPDPGPQSAR
jgi:predicted DNA-binding transcriptional regulator AlpA